jgi:hypothetical protein
MGIVATMHWLRPCSIDERMNESDAEHQEQKDPANPRYCHESSEETAWRILLAPAQAAPRRLYVYHFSVRLRYPRMVEEISHSRNGGTSKPHHPNHGKSDAFNPKRVND